MGESSYGVGATANAGDDRVGHVATLGLPQLRGHLAADHALKVADQHWVRVRTHDRAEDVVGIAHVGYPIANRLVGRVFQCLRSAGYGAYLGPQQTHPEDVQRLPANVFSAHVDDRLQAEKSRHGGNAYAVLAGAGFGYYPLLAHPPGQQGLTKGVVDLVGAGVVKVLALEVYPRSSPVLAKVGGKVERAGPAGIVAQVVVELGQELGIFLELQVRFLQLFQSRNQGFGDVAAAVGAKTAAFVGQ